MMKKEKQDLKELENLFKDYPKVSEEDEEESKIEKKNKLIHRDEEGNLAEPQTLSDLERNNRILEQNNEIISETNEWNRTKDKLNMGFKAVWTGMILWLVYYVIQNDVVNNLVRAFS